MRNSFASRFGKRRLVLSCFVFSVSAGVLGAQLYTASVPPWLPFVYEQAMLAPPMPGPFVANVPATVPQVELDLEATGFEGTYNVNGPTATASNPFFQSLGTNGRSCFTCHQPANGMSISVSSVQSRYLASQGRDPLFAPFDGANCPDAVKSSKPSAVIRSG